MRVPFLQSDPQRCGSHFVVNHVDQCRGPTVRPAPPYHGKAQESPAAPTRTHRDHDWLPICEPSLERRPCGRRSGGRVDPEAARRLIRHTESPWDPTWGRLRSTPPVRSRRHRRDRPVRQEDGLGEASEPVSRKIDDGSMVDLQNGNGGKAEVANDRATTGIVRQRPSPEHGHPIRDARWFRRSPLDERDPQQPYRLPGAAAAIRSVVECCAILRGSRRSETDRRSAPRSFVRGLERRWASGRMTTPAPPS